VHIEVLRFQIPLSLKTGIDRTFLSDKLNIIIEDNIFFHQSKTKKAGAFTPLRFNLL